MSKEKKAVSTKTDEVKSEEMETELPKEVDDVNSYELTPNSGESDLEKKMEQLEKEKNELEDLLKRKVAEFDNYKKRVLREKEEYRVLANKNLVLEILPIIDNFDRALKVADQNQNFKAMMEGLKMVHNQMENLLSNHEVEVIKSLGEEFDPNLHEAYLTEETDDEESANKVIDEFERGYRMGNNVIRSSKVKVAKKKA